MNFQKTIAVLALIILILLLVWIGVSLTKSSGSKSWPPIIGDCPDYWLDLSGSGEACFNAKRLGNCNIPSKGNPNAMNFNINPFNSSNGECAKYKWAKACGLTWDGITSGVSNPCNQDTSN
jgi:hypothetical protein